MPPRRRRRHQGIEAPGPPGGMEAVRPMAGRSRAPAPDGRHRPRPPALPGGAIHQFDSFAQGYAGGVQRGLLQGPTPGSRMAERGLSGTGCTPGCPAAGVLPRDGCSAVGMRNSWGSGPARCAGGAGAARPPGKGGIGTPVRGWAARAAMTAPVMKASGGYAGVAGQHRVFGWDLALGDLSPGGDQLRMAI